MLKKLIGIGLIFSFVLNLSGRAVIIPGRKILRYTEGIARIRGDVSIPWAKDAAYTYQYDDGNPAYYCGHMNPGDTVVVWFHPIAKTKVIAADIMFYTTGDIHLFVWSADSSFDPTQYFDVHDGDVANGGNPPGPCPLGANLLAGYGYPNGIPISITSSDIQTFKRIDITSYIGDTIDVGMNDFFIGYVLDGTGANPYDPAILADSSADAPYHSLAYLSSPGYPNNTTPGWWAYGLDYMFRCEASLYSNPPPVLVDWDKLSDSYTTGPRTVTAHWTDDGIPPESSGVAVAGLVYNVNGGVPDTLLSYSPISGDSTDGVWSFDIPGALPGDTVTYYMFATDLQGLTTTGSSSDSYIIRAGKPGNFLFVIGRYAFYEYSYDPISTISPGQFDTWDITNYGNPDSSVIDFYTTGPGADTIVWISWMGDAFAEDTVYIKRFLDNGGLLWIAGQDFFYGITGTYGEWVTSPGSFMREYLKLKGGYDDFMTDSMFVQYGVSGNPISGNLSSIWVAPYWSIAHGYDYAGKIDSLETGAVGDFYYATGEIGGYHYHNPVKGYSVVFQYWPWDYICPSTDASGVDTISQDTLTYNILNYAPSSGAPSITLRPTSFDKTLEEGDTTFDTLWIGNTGTDSLFFSFNDVQDSVVSLSFAKINRILPDHKKGLGKLNKRRLPSVTHSKYVKGYSYTPQVGVKPLWTDTIFYDDMEGGINGWTTVDYSGGGDLWHQIHSHLYVSPAYHSDSTSWWCGNDGTGYYSNNMDNGLISPPIYIPADCSLATLSFWEYYDTETGYDYVDLEITSDGGATWNPIRTWIDGTNGSWNQSSFDISSYKGDTVQIRFRLTSDYSVTYYGWFIDDVCIAAEKTDAPWLSETPQADTVAVNDSIGVIIGFDARALDAANYYASLHVLSNDPIHPDTLVPVHLQVIDTIPPSAITDLTVIAKTCTTMVLQWTAPGDNDTLGQASQYDIRYSTSPITEANFYSADTTSGGPAPAPYGTIQQFIVRGLTPSTRYYFAIKTYDEVPCTSAISNVPSDSTWGLPDIVVSPDSLGAKLPLNDSTTQWLNVINGGDTLKVSIWESTTPVVLRTPYYPLKPDEHSPIHLDENRSSSSDGRLLKILSNPYNNITGSRRRKAGLISIGVVGGISGFASTLNSDPLLSQKYTFVDLGNNWDYSTISPYEGIIVVESDYGLTATETDALLQFYNSGKPIIMGMDDVDDEPSTERTKIYTIFGISNAADAVFNGGYVNPSHPISSGIDTAYSVNDGDNDKYSENGAVWIVRDASNQYFVLAYEGLAKTVIFGEKLSSWWFNGNQQLIRNAINWTMEDIPWLDEDTTNFVVLPNDTMKVLIKYNSTGLLPDTTYKGWLKIVSNDPQDSILSIPVTLNIRVPHIGVYPDSIYRLVAVNDTVTDTITIKNTGAFNLIFNIRESQGSSLTKGSAVDTVLYDNMENGEDGWSYYGLWHQTSHRFSSDSTSWYYGIEGAWNYNTGEANRGALISPPIDLTTATTATLTFSHYLDCEGSPYEHGIVQISKDKGNTWETILEKDGTGGIWEDENIDISSWCGNDILIRFYFNTLDSLYNDFEGWYIDNVLITSTPYDAKWLWASPLSDTLPEGDSINIIVSLDASGLPLDSTYTSALAIYSNDITNERLYIPVIMKTSLQGVNLDRKSVPQKFSLSAPFPNPFRDNVVIRYNIPKKSNVEIMIYDITGRVLKVFNEGEKSPGYYSVKWRGDSKDGELSSGIYFIRLIADKRVINTRKIILMR